MEDLQRQNDILRTQVEDLQRHLQGQQEINAEEIHHPDNQDNEHAEPDIQTADSPHLNSFVIYYRFPVTLQYMRILFVNYGSLAYHAKSKQYCRHNLKNKLTLVIKELTDRISQIETALSAHHPGSRSDLHGQDGSKSLSSSSDICWYHFKYGKKANKCIKPCKFSQQQSIMASTGCSTGGRRLLISDRVTGTKFLIDTGSDLCCYPRHLLQN
ncbi:hypothetical protein J6590_063305 [Homalodisca vitripennis]|nr:hypothetical protein J6590_063305 [Homalodisca vitripennis]